MSQLRKQKVQAKRAAYKAKQEKEGNRVVWYIIGALIALGVIYAVYTVWLLG